MATNSKVKRTYQALSSEIKINPVRLVSQDIEAWKNAINAARHPTNPKRRQLLELYDNIAIDGQIITVTGKRKNAVQNKKILFLDKGGNENTNVTEWITQTPWFRELIGGVADSIPYGHSLIELIPEAGVISNIEIINRANVKPETGFMMWDYSNENNGIFFRGPQADPFYSKYLIEVGRKKDYGLLMSAAQYVIYKRGGIGDWAQFCELFGMPFRVGKYNMYDDAARRKLDEGLSQMGGAGYGVIPDGTSIEFIQAANSGSSSSVFKDMVELCDEQISKIFLGQTMTTDNGSSRSQSDTHREVEQDINLGDMIMVEYMLNWQFKNKMVVLGHGELNNGNFRYEKTQTLPLDKLADIALKVDERYPIAEAWWYEMFGFEKPGTKTPIKLDPKKKNLSLLPNHTCCGTELHLTYELSAQDLTDEENLLIKAIYNKDGGKVDFETFRKNTDTLIKAINTNLGLSPEYGTADNITKTMMEANVFRFGWDKNIAQIYALNQALNPDETFNEFKQKAVGILGAFNHAYLQTEYDFAMAATQNAAAWNQFKSEQNLFPYLQYQTAGDDRVRPAHAALDGMVFKLSDISWQSIYPPNGWNCRCEMIQLTSSESGNIKSGKDAIEALGDEYSKMKSGGFAVNRGETKEIFQLNKGYLSKINNKDLEKSRLLKFSELGLKPFADMKKLPALNLNKEADPAEIKASFDDKSKNVNGTRYLLFKDYLKRDLGLSKKDLNKHLKGKYVQDPEHRDQLFYKLNDILSDPDETYLVVINTTETYRYIKFYAEGAVIVNTEINAGLLQIKTWYLDDQGDKRRQGILIKKR